MKIEESVICVLFCVSVSSSSSQTQISAGQSVTLSCQLYSYSYAGVSCDVWIRSERIELFWVNQASVKKQTRSDSRYQISAPDHCLITLNTTLLNEDDNREWRCEVTQRDQVKTSVTYTVKSSAETEVRRSAGSLFRGTTALISLPVSPIESVFSHDCVSHLSCSDCDYC
uniref:Ig-like domain-containing protein n=1 Tax=Cyprinus carpio TaxID=7962 RepID=A0A8C1M972_CYPCA